MEYRILGRTGLSVSEIGMGCEGFVDKSDAEVLAFVDAMEAGGVNIIDLYTPNPQVRSALGKALRGRRDKASLVWDRFGQDVILVPDGEEHFTVTLPVVISPQFFGWLLGLDGSVTLVGPKAAVSAYRRRLAATLNAVP